MPKNKANMKSTQIKETLKDTESHIRKLDYQIIKAKQKLQILKSRKNILYAKLKLMKLAFMEVRVKGNKDTKQSKEVEQDLSQMLGNMLSLENGFLIKWPKNMDSSSSSHGAVVFEGTWPPQRSSSPETDLTQIFSILPPGASDKKAE